CTKKIPDILYYPGKNDYYPCEFISADPFLRVKDSNGDEIKTNLVGKYNFENVAAALAIGKYFGVEPSKAKKAIEDYTPLNNRSQVVEKESNTIIMDAYNANPDSMISALESFLLADRGKGEKLAILGDMLELGDVEIEEHEKIGSYTYENNIPVIFCGKRMEKAHKKNPDSQYFLTTDEVGTYFSRNKPSDKLILLKGSRAMKMENLLDFL
ncbi:MAG: UDP-N-acetylmuramoyl-tripeptide--D-alanyl-D-alanine ligase, partial [Cyclobacteriaceae bacterium]|nr:UDP-N-acetylmuramoyl-tripeptide--D-alanyl-D-alanine ligase [Cyclobacteriaceae bacterium]